MIKRALLIIIISVLSIALYAQKPVFRHYSVNEGLPSSEVYHIIQDSKGYIWIATNMGVSRFDGREFRNFDIQDGLTENTVFEVYEDETGRVWFVGFPFQLAYFSNDSIIPYKFNSVLRMIAGKGSVPVKKSFRVDKENNVVFSFLRDGKIYQVSNGGELTTLYNVNLESFNTILVSIKDQILASQKGDSEKEILLFADFLENKKVIRLGKSKRFSHGNIILGNTSDSIVLFAQNEILCLIRLDGSFETFDLKERIFWLSIHNESLFVGKEFSGVEKYNINAINKGAIDRYLANFSITSVLIDNEGGKWFSTMENGIFYLPNEGFYSYTSSDGLAGDNVKSIEIFDDKLFLGFANNAFNYIENRKVNVIRNIDSNLKSVKILKTFRDKLLWIVTDDYVYSYDKSIYKKYINNYKKFDSYSKISRFIFNAKVVYPLSESEILLGEAVGLSVLKNGKVIYNSYYDDNVELRIEAIERETDSSFLLGSLNGLWRYTGSRYEFLGVGNPLLKQRITDIVGFGEKDRYILGTKGSGLVVSMNDTIKQISRLNGLSSNSITSLLLTGNDLWIGTNGGLNLIDIRDIGNENPNVVVLRKEHGLISNEINQLAGNEDYIYIATNAGLTVFDRKKHKPVQYIPPVYINSISIMKRDTLVADNYRLSHNQNFITISYYGISFRDGGNLLYKYRLRGLSDEWVTTNNLEVEYAFLPPGDYLFEVIAINSDGNESLIPANLHFVILSPFWKTWWFISLSVLVIIGVSFAYYSRRLRQIRKEHALQNDTNWYRQQALTRQMDPHFVFNTLNSIQSYIIKNDRMASSQYLSKFAKLMRLILNNSQKQAVPLSNEIAALNLYMELESLRFHHKFEFSINYDSSVDIETSFIPAFLIQPFIENAIWHGIMGLKSIGIISVGFTKDAGQLICTIEDNGIGREKSKQMKSETEKDRKSLGISLVESRLKLLNNFYGADMKVVFTDLYADDKTPAGTRVVINLPIIN